MSLFKRSQNGHEEETDDVIDPELRLRTVRTAASAIAESIRSEQRAERRKKRSRFFRSSKPEKKPQPVVDPNAPPSKEVPGIRRNVYVNHPMPIIETDSKGEPIVRYARNKVRTTKYTILTFIPKNLFEQFRRIANMFFLVLVILQLFPVFGAATGAAAVMPLAFILTVTAIKDAVEDYRRATLDEEVNNSAATKLGSWRNVNQPPDSRTFFEKLFGLNAPGSVTKGVRKLREREAADAGHDVRIVLARNGDEDRSSVMSEPGASSLDLIHGRGAGGRRLDDIQSIDSHSYPPNQSFSSVSDVTQVGGRDAPSEFGSVKQNAAASQSSVGVVDWRRPGGSARWERTLWKKLEVGDIVLLRDNDQVPADIVVLATSDPDGMCYLETKNLDGETNLKPRRSVKPTMNITSEEDIERSSFYLDSEPPHANLYLYHGVLKHKDVLTGEKKSEPVTINELLLRGCMIRNTHWIIGLVVFTGSDTKIMLNGGDTPSKRSKIEKETNFNVIVNFIILFILCVISAVMNGIQDAEANTSADYFEVGSNATESYVINSVITFVSCLIAFQNIIPISLYISIEIVKTIQAFFISQDVDMYYQPYDTPCVPKTWNISDDLGQIEYIFSDKTGTLTQNVMEFQKCSVHGVQYGEGVTEAQRGAAMRAGTGVEDPEELNAKLDALKLQMLGTMERAFKNRYLQSDRLTLVSPKLASDLADRSSEQRGRLISFFRALALCHTVLADRPEPKQEPYHIDYKAESPDEAALVAAARDVGFPFVGKSKDTFDIEVMGQLEKWTLLKTLEFNSTRKRMSCVFRAPDGKLVLFCKGADSVIYQRLAKDHDSWLKDQTSKDMEAFANGGLRTLCIAYRYLGEDEYLSWSRTFDAASNAIENRDEEIDKANELIEHSLQILGATALEDKLQEGVPEAIETLHRAGIKLWILTGDKLQTAIEIGYSCNLLKPSMDIMILSADSAEQARSMIEAGLNKVASVFGPPSSNPQKRGFVVGAKASFAVVIDGDTLRHALTPDLKPLFLSLGTQCETVVCCRVSPAQKALTVKLVKEGRNALTLSIGDGANDVAMIQEANIGCGLFGLEGSQAAMSADYAFGQFRFLTKLLLVHGRWSYQRVADMHANFFYKNVIWALAMFWYLPFNNFQATYLYQFTFILLYNLAFTSLPVIILGATDQDLHARAALAFPQLYVRGIRGLEYTRTKFWMYMLDGLYQSAIVFFIPYVVWTLGIAVSWNGKGIDSVADFGTTVSVAAIFCANTYVGLNTNYWTFITWIAVFGSTLVMLIWIVVYSFFQSSDFVDEVIILFGELTFWTTVVFASVVALAPRYIVKAFKSSYLPLDKQIVREAWVVGDLKEQLGINHKRKGHNGGSGLESASMLKEQHLRSVSEVDLHDDYVPARTTGTPAQDLARNYNAVEAGRRDDAQYAAFVPHTGPSSPPPVGKRDSYSGHLAPNQYQQGHFNRNMAASPNPSYYSASDIPPPSPMPSPTYKLSSGEMTKDGPPSRRSSIATTRAASIKAPHEPMPSSPPAGRHPISPGAYEMRMRSPPLSPTRNPDGLTPHNLGRSNSRGQYSTHHAERSASAASYATANDDFFTAEDDHPSSPSSPSPTSYSQHLQQQYYLAQQQQQGPTTPRSSWQGGKAV